MSYTHVMRVRFSPSVLIIKKMESVSVESILKESVPVTILSICTKERPQSNKFLVTEEGLIEYRGEMLSPRDVFDRFIVDTPLLSVIVGEVMTRFIETQPNGKEYRWERNDILRKIWLFNRKELYLCTNENEN